jgi:hypothetical protein
MKKGLVIAAVALVATVAGGAALRERSPEARMLVHAAWCGFQRVDAKADFDRICDTLGEWKRRMANRSAETLSDAELREINAPAWRLADEMCSVGAIGTFKSLGNVPEEQRYALIKKGAEEAGLSGWTCLALEASPAK